MLKWIEREQGYSYQSPDTKLGYEVEFWQENGRWRVWFYANYEDLDKSSYVGPDGVEFDISESEIDYELGYIFNSPHEAIDAANQHYGRLREVQEYYSK